MGDVDENDHEWEFPAARCGRLLLFRFVCRSGLLKPATYMEGALAGSFKYL